MNARSAARGAARHAARRTAVLSAARLCAQAGLRPGALVEIGCGDGALLAALAERGLGDTLDGFELSGPAAELARRRPIPRARRIESFDGVRVPADDGAYDLAVLSHVLEHVPHPAPLLAEAARVARWVLVEVPLEANASARRPAVRAEAARIGHVQAFDRAAIASLLAGAGLRPVAELSDPLPLAHHAFFAGSTGARARAGLKTAVRRAAWRAAPRAAERAFTLHYAVLARG